MGVLYLVRHGQAGTRENYDSLSELGHEQARLLGRYFADRGIAFESALCGSLARQQATAREVREAAGGAIPEIVVDPAWSEFDLDQVYAEMAPYLNDADEDFRREYEIMQRAMAESAGAHGAPVHRRWNDCDRKLVRAWVEAQYPYTGESWKAFGTRIQTALTRIVTQQPSGNVIVFTSATPIGISAASTLLIDDIRAMQLAGVLHNSSFSMLRIIEGTARLFSFNATPHLAEPAHYTFR